MIDRRQFVQSMLVLGAAAGVRPSTVLFGFPPSGELQDLADAALASAKAAGASYADIRINRYRNQFIFTRDRRVQNIVNTEDYGFGVRVIVDVFSGERTLVFVYTDGADSTFVVQKASTKQNLVPGNAIAVYSDAGMTQCVFYHGGVEFLVVGRTAAQQVRSTAAAMYAQAAR